MAKNLFVRPSREGLLVRTREGGHRILDADGETVAMTPYWQKRLREGDVVEAKKPSTKPAKNPAKASKEAS